MLKQDVFGKYFGRNIYVMAHLGNGIDYTVSNTELGKAMQVNEIGNVALYSNEMTEVMVSIPN